MIQFLSILGDVMRVATFQWREEQQQAKRREEPASPVRWTPSAGRYPFRRSRP